MLLTLAVSLFTSRIVLNVLGVEDFGIYTVVGGVVALLGFLNSAMSTATQRFLAVDIGRGDWENLKKTFNASLIIHVGIAVVVLIVAETIGLWFIHHKLNIPVSRIKAANFVFQFSILASVVSITQVPFNALIVARERMNVFAIFSIVEVLLKLLIVYLLQISPFDHLKTYSFLLLVVVLLISTFYKIYCLRHFKESEFRWFYDKTLFRALISYSGWNLFGNAALVAKGQGTNMLLNIFFGTVVNAAYGIMMQVQNAVNQFVSNFQMAVNPQIIKLYATKEINQMQKLMFQSCKFSYFLLLILVCPIIFNIDFILKWWLKQAPQFTSIFVVLCLINLMIECLSRPLITGAMATGNIKWYQITVGTVLFLNLPLAYCVFRVSHDPVLFLHIAIVLSLITLVLRLTFLKRMIGLKIGDFVLQVILPVIPVTCGAAIVLYGMNTVVGPSTSFAEMVATSFVSLLINSGIVFLVGFRASERNMIYNLIRK